MLMLWVNVKGDQFSAGYHVSSIDNAYEKAEQSFAYNNLSMFVSEENNRENVVVSKNKFKRELKKRVPDLEFVDLIL